MLPIHLGGHQNTTHVDEGVLKFFIEKFQTKTFLDIGCGPGGQVNLASKLGLESYGIDGDYSISRNFDCIIHDFTVSSCKLPLDRFNLGWSVEFVEHVEEQYITNFIDTFALCDYLVITHAPPNKFGHHHVNCKTSDYWIKMLKMHGLLYSDVLTNQVKQASTMRREFMKNNGLVFINCKQN